MKKWLLRIAAIPFFLFMCLFGIFAVLGFIVFEVSNTLMRKYPWIDETLTWWLSKLTARM